MTRAIPYLLTAALAFPLCARSSPTLAIYVAFENSPAASSIRLMKQEVERLVRPSGMEVNWRTLSENRGLEAFNSVVVLRFKGNCSAAAPSEEPAGLSSVLASSEVANGKVLPFGEVECNQVRQALSYLQPEASAVERQLALGLALGRVVAHELYHMLAQTTKHARSGLSKASQSLPDLISNQNLRFGEGDSRAMRQGFR